MTDVTSHKELSLNLVWLKLFFVQEVMCDSALYKGLCGTLLHAQSQAFSLDQCHRELHPMPGIVCNSAPCTVKQSFALPKQSCETLLHARSCVKLPTALVFILPNSPCMAWSEWFLPNILLHLFTSCSQKLSPSNCHTGTEKWGYVMSYTPVQITFYDISHCDLAVHFASWLQLIWPCKI
jgi:hypothetical protein